MEETILKIPGKNDFFTQEAYKVLRTNLQFCGNDIRVIALTSCNENEGKSTVTLSLGKSLSELNKRVLVVDADMRKSIMAGRNTTAKNTVGLSELLTDQKALGDCVYTTQYEYLNIIFAGMLTVLEKTKEFVVHGGQKSPLWKCQCDCGNITLVRLDSLTSGSTKSCGCHMEEKIEKMRKAAGYTEGTQLSRIRDIPQTSNNSSGVVGVYYDKRRGKWRARLRFKGVTYQLGYFSNLEDAVSARKEAEKSIFGEFLASLNLKESEKSKE